MPRKEFESFTRLDASDVNTYLMDQSVMTFAGTAARGSAIATPVEGMYTHIEDTDRLEFWNGSSWISPFGSTLVGAFDFTAASSVIVDNVFSSAYKNYKVVLSTSLSGNLTLSTRLRDAGGAITGANYAFHNMASNTFTGAAFATVANNRAQTSASLWTTDTFVGMTLEYFNPFETGITTWSGVGAQHLANMFAMSGSYNSATSATGFEFNASAISLTGNVRVYGMRSI
jgi:hypothetical protein